MLFIADEIEVNSDRELRFDFFMQHAPAVAFIKDPDGRMIYVNRLFEDLWCTSISGCQGKRDDELWPPEVVRQLRTHDQHVLRSGERIEVVESVPTPDGKQRKFLITKFPCTDRRGGLFVGGVGIDITAHLEAEEELGRNASQHSVIARLASQALFQNDLESVLDEATMLMAQVLDVECCGFFEYRGLQPVLRAGTGWDAADFGQPLDLLNSQIAHTYEYGEPIHVSTPEDERFMMPPLFVKHGIQASITDVVRSRTQTLGVLGAFTRADRTWSSDETGFLRTIAALIGGVMMRFEVESALSDSEARYRELFQDAPAAYHEIDRNGCIRKVNRTECELLGYSESELLGRPVWELVAPGDRSQSEAAVRSKLTSGSPLTPFRRTYQRRDGSSVVFHISERHMLKRGSMDGICSIMIPETCQ